MVSFIRAAALRDFPEIARATGIDPLMLCRAVGISPSALSDPDERIRSDALGALLDLAARQSGVEDFALRMAERRLPSNWGVTGLLMAQQKTLGEAMAAGAHYIAAHYEGVEGEIEAFDDEAMVWINVDDGADVLRFDPAQRNELIVGSTVHVLRALVRRDWRPQRVGFTHAARGDLDRYKPYFGRTPLFDQDRLYLVLARADLDLPLDCHDPEAERILRQLAEQQLPEQSKPFSRAVALLISQRLAEGDLTADGVAAALDLDLRSLQRRLASEGASFSELLYAVRMNLARTFVESSRRPLAEVADLLGFSSLSAFSQWYSRTHGQSAAERRANLRGVG
ncbi:MAG: AraC family transcriptional regulator [Caulobacteraceae bacterium]